jgi:hypothetical protein
MYLLTRERGARMQEKEQEACFITAILERSIIEPVLVGMSLETG